MTDDGSKDFKPGSEPGAIVHEEGFHRDAPWNPYMDHSLTESKPEPVTIDSIESREPFNDVVKHQDLVQGYRRNRTLSDYPRQVRPWVRLGAVITLLAFVGGLVWDYVH